jgi:hypothetical protein
MNNTPTLTTTMVSGDAPESERRAAVRYACPHAPLLQAVVRPSFAAVTVLVDDVSTTGVGLFCDEPLEVGVRIAVLWRCGPQECWRTVRARVVRVAPGPQGGWIVGCVFDEPLQPGDVVALVRQQCKPEMADLRDICDSIHSDLDPAGATVSRQSGRRSSIRKPARTNIGLHCRRGSRGGGTNLATRLVDISRGGVQLAARELLRLREEVEIVLNGHGAHAPIQRMARVCWAMPIDGGGCCAGAQFDKPLSRVEMQILTRP